MSDHTSALELASTLETASCALCSSQIATFDVQSIVLMVFLPPIGSRRRSS